MMKLLEVELNGYIGIYNGLGIYKLYIDFRKCKNNILIIRGDNGSGKSTLWKALQPYPDLNNCFIPNMDASKIISYITNDNIIYIIRCIHNLKKDNTRSNKAYISKVINGIETELNSNGNINSFKEILENEFEIDSNFMALSMISADDRGLVDRTPSERKKFINPIINGIEVYNNINKRMNKLYSVYKNLISNIVTKIGYIGDTNKVRLDLSNIENKISLLEKDKDIKTEELAEYKSKIKILDPDMSIKNSYEDIYNKINQLNISIEDNEVKINSLKDKIKYNGEEDGINNLYKKVSNNITALDVDTQIIENDILNTLNDRENESKRLIEKQGKIKSFDSNEYENIINEINKLTKETDKMKVIIDKMNLDPYSITSDEYITALDILNKIKNNIDIFKADKDLDVMEKAIEYIKQNKIPYDFTNDINKLQQDKLQYLSEIKSYNNMKPTLEILKNRPSNCSINTCPFIVKAIEIDNLNINDKINELEIKIYDINNEIDKLSKDQLYNQNILISINQLKVIIRDIDYYKNILNKLPIDNSLKDSNIILDKILYYNFNEIDKVYSYLQYANYIEDYKMNQSILNEYNNKLSVYKEKELLINDILNDIKDINDKLKGLDEKIINTRNKINDNKNKLLSLKNYQLDIEVLIDLYNKRNTYNNTMKDYISKFNTLKTNIEAIKECLSNISIKENELTLIKNQIYPLLNERDKLKHSLVLLNDYNRELEEYNKKFNTIEIIRKYSSPTTGIQNIFMGIYMNKTLEIANNLLSMLFNGEYVIQQYILNENEFRIPCLGTGIMNDDISSMSLSQRSMISMIISFSLLNQSSNKYNILKLDEIDGGLDAMQRRVFINVLYKLINVLNIDQSIIISHNNEFDLSMCDIIYLKSEQIDNNMGGNIIFNFIN